MALSQKQRCVILAGMPRSGTSWAAQCLAYAPGFTYYREPDNYDRVPAAQRRFATLYLTRSEEDAEYLALMNRAVTGRIATAFTMMQDRGPLLSRLPRRFLSLGEAFPPLFFRKQHVLLKMVNANLNLDWIAARFPEVQMLYLVRHPCAQFESWKRFGWEPRPVELLSNHRLMSDHLEPYRDLLSSASTFWERAGAYWGAINFVVHRQQGAAFHLLVTFESLCNDPLTHFRNVYSRLGLEWNERAQNFLHEADTDTDGQRYSLARRSKQQIDKWASRLTTLEVEECRRYSSPFELPFYPNFDPWRATPLALV